MDLRFMEKNKPNNSKPQQNLDKDKVIEILKTCMDPEIGIDLWTLGLIYNIDIQDKIINIKMTFTTPFCPYGPMMIEEIEEKIAELGSEAKIEVVFDPPWEPPQEVRDMLGM